MRTIYANRKGHTKRLWAVSKPTGCTRFLWACLRMYHFQNLTFTLNVVLVASCAASTQTTWNTFIEKCSVGQGCDREKGLGIFFLVSVRRQKGHGSDPWKNHASGWHQATCVCEADRLTHTGHYIKIPVSWRIGKAGNYLRPTRVFTALTVVISSEQNRLMNISDNSHYITRYYSVAKNKCLTDYLN